MISIEDTERIAGEIVDELPDELFAQLNGGVNISPEFRFSPYAIDGDLIILGEYTSDPILGRIIFIYHGSFVSKFGMLDEAGYKEELRKIIYHELTHHLESLAGERDLEISDEEYIANYIKAHR